MKLTFKDLKPGDVFMTAGKMLFIKTSNKEFNAVNVSSGNLEMMNGTVQVKMP